MTAGLLDVSLTGPKVFTGATVLLECQMNDQNSKSQSGPASVPRVGVLTCVGVEAPAQGHIVVWWPCRAKVGMWDEFPIIPHVQ